MPFEEAAHTQHAIRQLQRPLVAVVAGAAADTNIAVSGIATDDVITEAIEFAAGVPTDRTATTSITSAGNIQCSVDTTGDTLVVRYYKAAGTAV